MLSLLKRVFCVSGALLFLLIVFLPGYTKLQELRDKNRDLRSQIKRLHQENELLEEKLKRLENDPVYQEEVVRERLGVVRKGEIPVKIIAEE